MLTLAVKSLKNRKFTTVLTIASIALSVTLLLGVERIRKEAKASFSKTISETDLIVGARPLHVFSLIVGESALLTMNGVVIGIGLLYGLLVISQPLILTRFGIFIEISTLSLYELWLIVIVSAAGIVIGHIPGYRIYRYSLADGMTIRI